MKVSTRSRYGLRLMVELGLAYPDGTRLLKEISENQNISEKYLSQIIIPLKGAGLVQSRRGSQGGYRLTRHPKNINVYDAIKVLEGDMVLIDCIKEYESCPRESGCMTFNFWKNLSEMVINQMKETSIEDLIQSVNPEISQSFVTKITNT